MKFLIPILLILLPACTVTPSPAPPLPPAAQGRQEADVEWSQHRATIYIYGLWDLPGQGVGGQVDAPTGLPLNAIEGCVVGEGIEERTKAHNDRIAERIQQEGLPAYSWKLREPNALSPRQEFTQRAGETPLDITHSPAKTPDGRHVVRILPAGASGNPPMRYPDWTNSRGEPVNCGLQMFGAKAVYALWGKKDAAVLYLRWRDERGRQPIEWYAALDVATGRRLRVENDQPGSL